MTVSTGASEEVRRIVAGERAFLSSSKDEREMLEASLNQMRPDEELRALGVAYSIDGCGGKSQSYTYYMVTSRGLYFGAERKAGFLRRQKFPAFLDLDEIHSGEIQDSPTGVPMAFLSLWDRDHRRLAFIAFDDSAFSDGAPLQQAYNLGRALGLEF